jgi:hypothetical protein
MQCFIRWKGSLLRLRQCATEGHARSKIEGGARLLTVPLSIDTGLALSQASVHVRYTEHRLSRVGPMPGNPPPLIRNRVDSSGKSLQMVQG